MEALILVGGKGTRLKSVVSDVPKPMAKVNGVPFLEILLRRLVVTGISRIILLTGYMHEAIESHFGNKFFCGASIDYSREETPLGTGGAIRKGLQLAKEENVLLLNGDTLFDVDIRELYSKHMRFNTSLTLSLKHMRQCERYGTVEMVGDKVISFMEKGEASEGYINGGVYACQKDIFEHEILPEKFSFEEDYLIPSASFNDFRGLVSDGYFIDIGIPDDYARIQREVLPRNGE